MVEKRHTKSASYSKHFCKNPCVKKGKKKKKEEEENNKHDPVLAVIESE